MRRLLLLFALLSGCASIRDAQTHPHPTPDHQIVACVIQCPEGWDSKPMKKCRGNSRQWTVDVHLTGEDDVPGDPEQSRWLTGLTSFGADFVTRERLRARGIAEFDRVDETKRPNLEWSRAYVAELKHVRREMGNESFAAYLKSDVVLTSCESYRQQRCFSKAATNSPCGAHPGEPDPLRPNK